MFGRIKGANSDYKWVKPATETDSPIQEERGDELYLQVFVCPDGQPSRVEKNEGQYCQGTDATCPSKAKGHALVHLNKKDGVSLVADNGNRLVVDQDGRIRLLAQKEVILEIGGNRLTIKADGIELSTAQSGQVTINGNLRVTGKLTVEGDLDVKGKITGNGALTDAYKAALDRLIQRGG